MGYTYIDSTRAGDWSANCAPDVYVLETVNSWDGDRTVVRDALVSSLDDTLDSGYIKGYNVHEYSTDLWLDCSGSNADLLVDIGDWRSSNGFTSDGTYIGLHRCSSDDLNPGASWGDAWSEPADVHVSFAEGSPKTTTVHETAHCLINHNCSNVQNFMEKTDGNWDEHTLGTVLNEGGIDKYTPFGGANPGERGTCSVSDASGVNDRTLTYSYCTKQSIEYSANHSFSGHLEDAC